ncbi:MAG TPA: EAL domain-containing protein [Mycobacteriales bacterium]|nr:EAL domain-containing protein [Mycobacteriales bacterium]
MPATRLRPATHAVVATDAVGRIRTWDAGAAAMFGRTAAEVTGRRLAEVVAADSSTAVAHQAVALTLRADSWSGSLAVRHPERAAAGAPVCQVTATPAVGEDGQLLAVVWTFVDARAERRTHQALRRLSALIESSGDAVIGFTPDGVITSWNAAAEELYGHKAADIVGKPFTALAPPQRAPHIQQMFDAVRQGAPRKLYDATGVRADGSRVELRVTLVPVIDADGVLVGITAMSRDVTPMRQMERELVHRDTHDELTGLLNRRTVEQRLEAMLVEAEKTPDDEVAVLFVAVDRFATVNDAWGHAAGDVLLAELGERLRAAVRSHDVIARFGGDEFVLVCSSMSLDAAHQVARRVHRLVQEPLQLNGHRVTCTVSVGVALSPSYDAQTLISRAAAAVADAKDKGRACTRVYDAELAHRAQTRLNFASELGTALATDKLELRYQPVFDVRTGAVLGVEALMRWVHPVHGNIAPAEFLQLAKDTGMMTELDKWALQRACAEGAKLIKTGVLLPSAFIAVNVAGRTLTDPQLSAHVTDALVSSQLPAANLVLEVTENGMLADPQVVAETMRALRARGVGIALDDFGTGSASLAHLRNFPLTALKVDRSFVEAMRDDADELTIVASVIDLARALGVTTIAEGVETRGQLDLLAQLGCPAAQGFLWTEALSPADLARLLMRPDGEASRALAPKEESYPTSPPAPASAACEVTAEHGLRRLLQLHQEGQSPTTIAAALNAAGFRTPSGQRWHSRTVSRSLARLALSQS